jgi:hypothetical protein
MAKTMRTWTDFANQRLNPFEYAEELPEHLADVEQFIAEDARCVEGQATAGEHNTGFFLDYVEYFERAEVHESVMTPIVEAGEAMEQAAEALRHLAEALRDASDAIGRARIAADAEYADNDVPNFAKANG